MSEVPLYRVPAPTSWGISVRLLSSELGTNKADSQDQNPVVHTIQVLTLNKIQELTLGILLIVF